MDFRLAYLLLFSLLSLSGSGQSPFVASWNFEGNRGGSTNNPSVTASNLNLSGVEEAGFPNGQSGDAVSIRRWPTGGFDGGNYVEFSVTPQGYRMNITSVSFAHNRSDTGPLQLVLRSSADGFNGNLASASVGTNFSNVSVGQSLNDVESTVAYRIYAYSAGNVLGTLRLDNIRINGLVQLIPLPVELVTFKAQPIDNQVQILWETAWEQQALQFELQRSSDLKLFVTIHRATAAGDTRERMRYEFIDAQPLSGISYYRLRQTDRDGAATYSKFISVIRESEQPQLWLYENLVSNDRLRLRLHRLQSTDLQLIDCRGKVVDFSTESLGGDDFMLYLPNSLPAGIYFLVGRQVSERILLMR